MSFATGGRCAVPRGLGFGRGVVIHRRHQRRAVRRAGRKGGVRLLLLPLRIMQWLRSVEPRQRSSPSVGCQRNLFAPGHTHSGHGGGTGSRRVSQVMVGTPLASGPGHDGRQVAFDERGMTFLGGSSTSARSGRCERTLQRTVAAEALVEWAQEAAIVPRTVLNGRFQPLVVHPRQLVHHEHEVGRSMPAIIQKNQQNRQRPGFDCCGAR